MYGVILLILIIIIIIFIIIIIIVNRTKIPKQGLWSLKGQISNKIPGGTLKEYNHNKIPWQGLWVQSTPKRLTKSKKRAFELLISNE